MPKTHTYHLSLEWTGNTGTGTSHYWDYRRDHVIRVAGKPDLLGSSDPVFHGDRARWNPEELLVAALSACHQLAYLHLAALAGIVVVAYTDEAVGEMTEDDQDSGQFRSVVLHPVVTVTADSMVDPATELHAIAHAKCFIANSVNFPVHHQPLTLVTLDTLHRNPHD